MWEFCLKRFLKCFVYGEIKILLKGGEYEKFFDVSNLEGELEFTFVCILCFILLFICLSFHICSDVFFFFFFGVF